MSSFCLKCRVSSTKHCKKCYFQNVLYVIVKNKDLLKNKKQKEY